MLEFCLSRGLVTAIQFPDARQLVQMNRALSIPATPCPITA